MGTRNGNRIEEPDDEEEEKISYEEKTAILRDDKSETIKKINMKNNDVRTLKESIKSGKRIRYKKIYAKQNQVIEISVAGDKKFQNIKVGIVDKNNNIRYIQDNKVEEVIHAFIIKKEGIYNVFIESENKDEVEIIAMIALEKSE